MTDPNPVLDDSRFLVVGPAAWLAPFAERLETHFGATVTVAETADEAVEIARTQRLDCVVTEQALDGSTGVELTARIREVSSTLPVVIGTESGSECVTSEAFRAGVTDYVAVSEPKTECFDELLERTERAVREGTKAATRRERARQFDAVFHDERTATWVLDPEGRLARVNPTALEMIDGDEDALVGAPFWSLPWWSHTDAVEQDVRHLVNEAREGRFGNAVISPPNPETQHVVDLSVRPVEDDRGDVVSIVVEGIDVTEQVELERNLRQSEELHRVTLNNMTDTVLITDEDSEYTYVCPNVHFIFGYTADEIRERGTIDSLLGADLFDRERLADEGVLKNIECTVTDKAGREHTLLVNVREVSIQGGRLLYSCRDITKRKQRERALTTLQETARAFLYAETQAEIADQVVADAAEILGLDATGVYLFDVDANELRPAAWSQAMAERHGPLPDVHADGETLVSSCFVTDETLVFDDVHTSEKLENRATDLRSAMYIPLGNHGVFVAGSVDVGAFEEVTQELADLLAATAEAALDRVDREAQLREQDRELQRRNQQLAALNRINDTIREIDQAIVQAETQDEIDHTVCERLTDTARFKFAWIGSVDPATDTVEPRAWAGDDQGYLDSQPIAVTESETDPAGQTAATDDVTMVTTVASELRSHPWRSEALTRDFLSVLSIPLVYNDLRHGVLTVYADTKDAFDETTRAVLTELGETVAAALSAIERKHALLADSMTRVEFAVQDSTIPLSLLAQETGATLSYSGSVQHATADDTVFVTVEDGAVSTVSSTAADMAAIDDVRQVSQDESDGGVLKLQLSRPVVPLELADHGAILREVTATPTETTLVVDVPETLAVRNVTRVLRETFPSAQLRRKETLQRAESRDLRSRFLTDITDRQFEVVQTAYYSGYFESPREKSGDEVARTLEISPPAFYQHVRTVQRKLFATVFEEKEGSALENDEFNNE